MQTSPDRLSDLIARLEKATGPCRKLDLDISVAVNYRDAFTGAIRAEWSVMADDINVYDATGRRYFLDPVQFVPQWTRSIDVAVSLVLEGSEWSRHRGANGKMTMQVDGPGPIGRHGQGATPAIALCIAALKARMQGGDQ